PSCALFPYTTLFRATDDRPVDRCRWSDAKPSAALSAPILRRSAAADRDRPGVVAATQADCGRRAGFCTGRVDPVAGGEPASGSEIGRAHVCTPVTCK